MAPGSRAEARFGQLGVQGVVAFNVQSARDTHIMTAESLYAQHARYHSLVLVAPWYMVQRLCERDLLVVFLIGGHFGISVNK